MLGEIGEAGEDLARDCARLWLRYRPSVEERERESEKERAKECVRKRDSVCVCVCV